MEFLVRRDDNTLAYIHKMHNYNPKLGTPRPKSTCKKKKLEKDDELEKQLQEILQLFL